jgi:hypothetical protein
MRSELRFLKSSFLFVIYILGFAGSLFLIYKDSFRHRTFPSDLQGPEAGVIFYDHWRASDGYNLINTYFEQPSCVVYTMMGDFVFRFPGGFCQFLSSGEFFTATDSIHFYNSSGRLVWKTKEEFIHHGVDLAPGEKEIFIVAGDAKSEGGKKIRYDAVRGYSLKGEKIFEWKLGDHFEYIKQFFPNLAIEPAPVTSALFQYTQYNSVQVLPANSLEEFIPAFKRGNILVNDFRFPMIFILDRESKKIVWSLKLSEQEWAGAHTVRVLANGHLLYFYNKNESPEKVHYSSVVEYDPLSQKKIWQYSANPLSLLNMSDNGGAYKLPNGNVLVTHNTSGGSAFEITASGRLVWEWAYPVKDSTGKSEQVYQVQRIPKDKMDRILKVWRSQK